MNRLSDSRKCLNFEEIVCAASFFNKLDTHYSHFSIREWVLTSFESLVQSLRYPPRATIEVKSGTIALFFSLLLTDSYCLLKALSFKSAHQWAKALKIISESVPQHLFACPVFAITDFFLMFFSLMNFEQHFRVSVQKRK